ncbi:uncharacterized protein GGS22DRAFT_182765 [Annulohypoxylon maeteangense]|uniref:uncharacterized protein n=1 Tax=Annulohypoxylon maeteangense TaxID=1927788 RepID=UPI0020078046|nr:uncharacterized protein GGS22DRAFT_182765 [Annulohypoxylon maeteangense]KAI0879869.1 hypothetical protein GGS22DRAFT_182765 [Annulohypoxylon maeteangense]
MASMTRSSSAIAFVIAVIVVLASVLYRFKLPYLTSLSPHFVLYSSSSKTFGRYMKHASSFRCPQHTYTTEIISLDPLLIYIDSFLAPVEIEALLEAGESEFAPSQVYKRGRNQDTSDRTSSSAGLPRDNPTVQCVLERAEGFLGTMLDPSRDDIGPPQLVRYTAGQRFNRHRDWYERPQPVRKGMLGRGKGWNRIASFFAILQDQCTGGETWFPLINATIPLDADGKGDRLWKTHENGGLMFRPVSGNALFWVNLFANGTGDDRTIHAGLPVEEGLKTAMNIWPRKFYD